MDYLPTKRFAWTAFFVVIVFTGWYYFFVFDGGMYNEAKYASNTLIEATSTAPTDLKAELAKLDVRVRTFKKEYLKLEPELTAGDLHTTELAYSPDEDLHAYGVALVKALDPIMSTDRSNEVDTMLTALNKATTSAAKEIASLTTASARYSKARDALLALTIPPEAQSVHLALVNSISSLAGLTSNMAKVKEDPVLAVTSGNIYSEESTNFLNAIHDLNRLFDLRAVTFTDSEKGTVKVYEAQ